MVLSSHFQLVPILLRSVLLLCHLSAVNALATNVECVPYKQNEALLDFSGAKPQRFLHLCSPPG